MNRGLLLSVNSNRHCRYSNVAGHHCIPPVHGDIPIRTIRYSWILKKAAEWESFHDEILDSTVSLAGGWGLGTSVYNFDWGMKPKKSSKKFKRILVADYVESTNWPYVKSSGIETDAVALTHTSWFFAPGDKYLSAAGLVNRALEYESASFSLNESWDQSIQQHQLDISEQAYEGKIKSIYDTPGVYYILNPLVIDGSAYGNGAGFDLTTQIEKEMLLARGLAGNATYYLTYLGENPAAKVPQASYSESDVASCLGSEGYPGVIVRTHAQKEALERSQSSPHGLYRYRKYDEKNAGSLECYLAGKFSVDVAPSGLMRSWLDGSVESFLLCEWGRAVFFGDLSDAQAGRDVKSYYEQFYRSTSQLPM